MMFGDANGTCDGCKWREKESNVCSNCFNYGSWHSPDNEDDNVQMPGRMEAMKYCPRCKGKRIVPKDRRAGHSNFAFGYELEYKLLKQHG